MAGAGRSRHGALRRRRPLTPGSVAAMSAQVLTLRVTVAAALLLTAGCSGRDKRAEPAPATTTATTVAESVAPTSSEPAPVSASPSPLPTSVAPVTTTPPPSVSAAPSTSPTPAPAASPSPTAAPAPSRPAAPTAQPPDDDPAAQVRLRPLLLAGRDLGDGWTATDVPADEDEHEQGDLCGTVTASEADRLVSAATDLTHDTVEGAGRHQVAQYRPGRAAAVAQAMVKRLASCPPGQQEFDGQLADVAVTPTGPNSATYSLTFGPGAVNHGAVAITAVGDFVSTSAVFANDARTAAALAAQIDAAARKKLAAVPAN